MPAHFCYCSNLEAPIKITLYKGNIYAAFVKQFLYIIRLDTEEIPGQVIEINIYF